MDSKETFYRTAIKPTRIAIIIYVIVKQFLYTLLVPEPKFGWVWRLIISVVLVAALYAVTSSSKLTRRQITFTVLLIISMSEITFYTLVGGDRLIFPFLIGCALVSIMFSDLKASAAALGIAVAAFAVVLFVFNVNVAGMTYQYVDSLFDFASVAVIGGIAMLVGKYTVGTLERARVEAEAANRAKSELLNLIDRDAQTFRVYYEVSHQMSDTHSVERIFKVVSDAVARIVPSCRRLIFLLHDPADNRLRIRHIAGDEGELSWGMEWQPDSRGIYSYAFNNKCVVNIFNLQDVDNYRFAPDEPACDLTLSLVVFPIMSGDRCVGLFSAESDEPGIFGTELEQVLKTLIENAAVALTRAQLYLKMERLATTDGLTGLHNRRTFQETMRSELERAKRYGRPLSLLLMDIDFFKSFNDIYGHQTGDLVLREIADCIRGVIRSSDFPARWGGEEFAVILPETCAEEALLMAERIRNSVETRRIELREKILHVTVSLGGVTFPENGDSEQELIAKADLALYNSKNNGRNMVTVYTKELTILDVFERR